MTKLMEKLMEEQATYTKQDLIKLINDVGANLVLKKDKIVLETEIQRKQKDIEYKKEFFVRVQKQSSELNSVLRDMEERSSDIKNQILKFKAEKDSAIRELEQLSDIEKKASLLSQRNSEIDMLTEKVKSLKLKIDDLTPEYARKMKEKGKLDLELAEKEDLFRSLRAEFDMLANRKEYLLSRIPVSDMLSERQNQAELSIVENTAIINQLKAGLKSLEAKLPSSKTKAEALGKKKETLTVLRDNLQIKLNELANPENKEILAAEVQHLSTKNNELTASIIACEKNISGHGNDIARTEKSIRDEEEFSARYAKLNEDIKAKQMELTALNAELDGLILDAEADSKILELLGPLNEYTENINSIVDKLRNDHSAAFEKLVHLIASEVK